MKSNSGLTAKVPLLPVGGYSSKRHDFHKAQVFCKGVAVTLNLKVNLRLNDDVFIEMTPCSWLSLVLMLQMRREKTQIHTRNLT